MEDASTGKFGRPAVEDASGSRDCGGGEGDSISSCEKNGGIVKFFEVWFASFKNLVNRVAAAYVRQNPSWIVGW